MSEKFIMKNVLVEWGTPPIFEYLVFNDNYQEVRSFKATPMEAVRQTQKLGLRPVSPMEVYNNNGM